MKTRVLKPNKAGYVRIAETKTYPLAKWIKFGAYHRNQLTFIQLSKRDKRPPNAHVMINGAYFVNVGTQKGPFAVVYDIPFKLRKLKTNKDGYITISETTSYKHAKILKVGVNAFNPNTLSSLTTDSQVAAAKQSRLSYKFKGKLYVYRGGINQIIYVEYGE